MKKVVPPSELSPNSCLHCRPSGQLTAAQRLKLRLYRVVAETITAVKAETFFFFGYIHITSHLYFKRKLHVGGGGCLLA